MEAATRILRTKRPQWIALERRSCPMRATRNPVVGHRVTAFVRGCCRTVAMLRLSDRSRLGRGRRRLAGAAGRREGWIVAMVRASRVD